MFTVAAFSLLQIRIGLGSAGLQAHEQHYRQVVARLQVLALLRFKICLDLTYVAIYYIDSYS